MSRPYFHNIFKSKNCDCIIIYSKNNKKHSILIKLDKINNFSNSDLSIKYDPLTKSLSISNISSEAIRLISVEILMSKIDDSVIHIFQNGYQSWSPSFLTGINTKQKYVTNIPILSNFINMGTNLHHNKDSKYWGFSNVLISNMIITLNDKNGITKLFGFADFHNICGEFIVINSEYLIAYEDYDKIIEVGDTLLTSKILEIKGDNIVYEQFADKIGNYMRENITNPTGWCSWYSHGVNINEEKIISNINKIYNSKLNIKYIQIDDGYTKNIGDWLEIDKQKFPNGLDGVIAKIKSKNYKAGIWLAPFLASKTSNILKKHPDWILKDYRDKMVFATFNNAWNGNYTYSLDLTHPGVKAYIHDVFNYYKTLGFEYFKLDFLCAGMLKGQFYDKTLNRVEVYRNALKIIRNAVGKDSFILGCGAPISASIGLVDGMRISPDTDHCWDPPFLAKLFANGVGIPCIKYQLMNVLSRHFMHKKWWINDPDIIILSDKISDKDFIIKERILINTDGPIFFSDDIDNVMDKRKRFIKELLV